MNKIFISTKSYRIRRARLLSHRDYSSKTHFFQQSVKNTNANILKKDVSKTYASMSYVQVTLSKLKIWSNKIVIARMQMTMSKKMTRSSQTKQNHLMSHPLKDSLSFKKVCMSRVERFFQFNPPWSGWKKIQPNSTHHMDPTHLDRVRPMGWTIFFIKKN